MKTMTHFLTTVLLSLVFATPSMAQGGGIFNQGGTLILNHTTIGGSAQQAVKLLVSNPSGLVPACDFTGVVRGDDITPPFGSGLQDVVFEPISLAPGESTAIVILFAPSSGIGSRQELALRIETDNAAFGPCPLLIGLLGYDRSSEATEFLIDRYTFGLEKTFSVLDKIPLGFAGGNATQTARLTFTLLPDNTGLQCDIAGEVIAKAVSRDDAEVVGGHTFKISENNSPIPSAVVDILFGDLGATADSRFDAELSVQFDRRYSAACLKRVNATIQIFDQTGETQAALPRDRVFFNFNHFSNIPLR